MDGLAEEGVEVLSIISDWNLPRMKGDELLKIIKNKHSLIGLVIVTGQADKTLWMPFKIQYNWTAVLSNPWDRFTLIKILSRFVQNIAL